VAWLIDAKLAAPRKRDVRKQPPTPIVNGTARNVSRPQLRDERLEIVDHEVELVHVVRRGRVDGKLGRRQSKYQPAVPDVDVPQFEHVAKEGPIQLGIRTVDDRVATNYHNRQPPNALRISCGQFPGGRKDAVVEAPSDNRGETNATVPYLLPPGSFMRGLGRNGIQRR
jgi:hypothetical protein